MTEKKKYRNATVKTDAGRKRYAEITSDGVTVGCQFVPARIVRKIAAMLVDVPKTKGGVKMESLRVYGRRDALDGKWFTAVMNNVFARGRLRVEDTGGTYMCQDILDGAKADRKRGFKYSWWVGDGSPGELSGNEVSDVRVYDADPLPNSPKTSRPVKWERAGMNPEIKICLGSVRYSRDVLSMCVYTMPNKEVRKLAALLAKVSEPQKTAKKK